MLEILVSVILLAFTSVLLGRGMTDKSRLYTVFELAPAFDLTPRTVRVHEDKGLLSSRRAGTRRIFDYREDARLSLVPRFQPLGFELSEVKGFLDLYTADHLNRLTARGVDDPQSGGSGG